MTLSLSGKVVLPADGEAYLRNLLQQPRMRPVVSRILNDASRDLKIVCEEVANEDLHRRPDDRRTKESLAHGPSYHESFEIITAKEAGPDKMKSGVRNTHPFARAVEHGTPAHLIVSYPGKQSFPWNLQRLGPHNGAGMGDFLVTGDRNFAGNVVRHTGAGAKRIMARARRRYLDRTRKVLNRR